MKENEDKDNSQTSLARPQPVAQRCPVCNGFGTLKYGTMTCHACSGRGYIVIEGSIFGQEGRDYEATKRFNFN